LRLVAMLQQHLQGMMEEIEDRMGGGV
jgi:hypothetical protein